MVCPDRNQALSLLRAHEGELRRRGVRRAALFGSVVRGEAQADSDVDILIELDEENSPDLFAYAGLVDYIRALFTGPVDVANRASLKPHVRPAAEREAVYAF